MKIKIKYGEYDNCSLHFFKYINGQQGLAIQDEYGHSLINVTKYLFGQLISKNQILIKNYSENEGILKCLIEQGIIADTSITVQSGYVDLHICELLIDPKNYQEK